MVKKDWPDTLQKNVSVWQGDHKVWLFLQRVDTQTQGIRQGFVSECGADVKKRTKLIFTADYHFSWALNWKYFHCRAGWISQNPRFDIFFRTPLMKFVLGHRRNSGAYTWFQLSFVWSHVHPRITNYILSTRSLSLLFRKAVIRPLLKKPSLESNGLKNIIQFPFLSK